jgi:metal-sulfur cluster biosynthetic enzyme
MMDDNSHNKPEWEIDKTHPQYHDELVENLSGVVDPELGFSVLELGLVRNISIQGDRAHLVMILTTAFCPYGPSLMEQTRQKVEQVLGLPTTMEYGEGVWDESYMDKNLFDSRWGLYS